MECSGRSTSQDDRVQQFIISREQGAGPDGWPESDLDGFRLSRHPSLAPTCVRAPDGRTLGWFLGTVVDPDLGVLHGDVVWSEDLLAPLGADAAPAALERLAGRWIFLLSADSGPRLYLDGCGSLAAVYDRRRRRVASTVTLFQPDAPCQGFEPIPGSRAFPGSNQFYPAGLTAHPEYRRLLPNHHLDLATMESHRDWPLSPPSVAGGDTAARACVDVIRRETTAVIRGLAEDSKLTLSVTAGRDSRMLLACARGLGARMDTFSFDFPGDVELVDTVVGALLARRAGYDHRVVDLEDTTDREREAYLSRIGYAGSPGKATDFYKAVAGALDPGRVWLIGYAGEVGRAFYWNAGDGEDPELVAEDLLGRMNLPAVPSFIDAMESWLASLPRMAATSVLDFLYHEQRMGAWAAPHLYGVAPIRNAVTPFSSRAIMKSMHRLPARFKRGQLLARILIEGAWPELLDLPFQRIPGVGGSLHHLRHRKVGPAMNRFIDSIGRQQGKSRTFDRLYVGARSVYRRLKT